MRLLLSPNDNPKARWLYQSGNMLHVVSECCGSEIEAEYVIQIPLGDGSIGREVWARCRECGTNLERNERGWVSDVPNLDYHYKTRPESWGPWGEFWFGLPTLAMKVDQ